MHDLLLDHQDALKPRDLVGYAGELGLDVDRFTRRPAQRTTAPAGSPRTSTAPT